MATIPSANGYTEEEDTETDDDEIDLTVPSECGMWYVKGHSI